MKKPLAVLLLFVCLTSQAPLAAEAPPQTSAVLDTVVVSGDRVTTPTRQTTDTVYTGSQVTRTGIEAQGTKATISVYESVKILPGISVESADPYGLSAEQKNIRIRGVRGYLGALTVFGVPSWGGNPMGPREYLFDTENLDSIAVYKGAVPADLGTGVGARGGAIELRPLWPKETFGVRLSQGFGTDTYRRTYLRLDTGTLPRIGTAVSLSGSVTNADKWKGPGDLGPRRNMNVMLRQPLPGGTTFKLWVNVNDLEQHLYRPLSYDEVERLGANYDEDYNHRRHHSAGRDIDYYRYNRGEYRNRDVIAEVPLALSEHVQLSLKPYWSDEDTNILGGSTNKGGIITKRSREIERYGVISRLDMTFSPARATLGYWFESSDMLIRTANYDPVTSAYKGSGMHMHNDGNGIVHSPFAKVSGTLGTLDWQAGIKFFYYEEPESQGYTASSPARPLRPAQDLSVKERHYEEWLPSLGLAWHVTDAMELYGSYGRNQIRPYAYLPLINMYNQNRAKFQASRISLNELFSGYDMEISDNYELGVRFWWERVELSAAVYYVKHRDLLTTVCDRRVGLSYYRNMGDATGHGLEIESSVFINKNITLFLNPTYTRLTYDNDLTYQGTTIRCKDNQVVDTPAWTFKAGMILTWRDFEFVPMLRYMNRRYGDAGHSERIDNYTVVDIKLGYTVRTLPFAKTMQVTLECNNLFGEEYVSVIDAMDDNRAGSTSYNVGSPFSTMLNVTFNW